MLADLNAVPPEVKAPLRSGPDVLDLTEAMASPVPRPAEAFRTIDAQSDIVFDEAPAPAPEPAPRAADRPRSPGGGTNGLMSATTSAAVDSAFNALAQTVLVHNARTLEDLVREMLRPLLKTWLDDNLPGLVERLVRAEIERVSRGRS
jgi:cell pole-organizing protein PopZ